MSYFDNIDNELLNKYKKSLIYFLLTD
jgi:hypothetical protein